jgi:hypothetical protein
LSKPDEFEIDIPTPEVQLDISIKEDKKKESCNSSSSDESKKKLKGGTDLLFIYSINKPKV